MAQIQFCRAEAFMPGDFIIQIDIDGKKAGSLVGARLLRLELPAGVYTLQARMFGNRKGAAVVLNVDDHTDALTVDVSGTRLGLIQRPLEAALTVLFSASPWFPLWFLCLKMTLLAVWAGYLLRRWKQVKPQLLRLHVRDGIISESRAFSTRLSSPR